VEGGLKGLKAKLNWNFQRVAQRNKCSVGGAWICSGTTQKVFQTKQY